MVPRETHRLASPIVLYPASSATSSSPPWRPSSLALLILSSLAMGGTGRKQ